MKVLESENKPYFPFEDVKESNLIDDPFSELYNYINQFKSQDEEILMSIILPMYNEEHTIGKVLGNLPKGKLIEIIVVDDHSTDNSLEEINKVNGKNEIQVIKHKENKGYGAAIVTGINNACGRVSVTMDSDGQHSPYDILAMIKPIFEGEADYTIGSRYLGSYFYKLPVSTRLGEVLIEKLIQIFFGKKIMNNQNGFRAFNKKIIPLFNNTKYQDYTSATEIILKTALKGYRIKECPIKLYHRQFGSSKIGLTKLTLNLFSCLFLYYLKKIKILLHNRRNGASINNGSFTRIPRKRIWRTITKSSYRKS